jgi:hypothetical protein
VGGWKPSLGVLPTKQVSVDANVSQPWPPATDHMAKKEKLKTKTCHMRVVSLEQQELCCTAKTVNVQQFCFEATAFSAPILSRGWTRSGWHFRKIQTDLMVLTWIRET